MCWAIFAVLPVFLFTATVAKLGHHQSAAWSAFAVIAIAIPASVRESLFIASWKRDLGEVLLYGFCTLAAGAGLWWVLHGLAVALPG